MWTFSNKKRATSVVVSTIRGVFPPPPGSVGVGTRHVCSFGRGLSTGRSPPRPTMPCNSPTHAAHPTHAHKPQPVLLPGAPRPLLRHHVSAADPSRPWLDRSASPVDRASALLVELSLDEKIAMTYATHTSASIGAQFNKTGVGYPSSCPHSPHPPTHHPHHASP